MTSFRTILVMVAAVAALSAIAATPSFAAAGQRDRNCLSDQQIQAAIASGQIRSWPQIKKLARIPNDFQEVSDVKVCMVNGVPFYTVNLVSSSGEARKIVLNAVDGAG